MTKTRWNPPTTFPFVIPASRKLIEEFAGCECGRWEDLGSLETETPIPPDPVPPGVTAEGGPWFCGYQILDRRREGIEIRDPQELIEILWAITTGTTALFSWGMYRAAVVLRGKLHEAAGSLGVAIPEWAAGYPESPEFGVGEDPNSV